MTIEPEPRGIVVPFQRARRSARPTHVPVSHAGLPHQDASGNAAARVSVDHEVNTEWDMLIRLATQAWSWRDPESLDVLERTVTRLRTWIGHDWEL
jgi:hypothetical protein